MPYKLATRPSMESVLALDWQEQWAVILAGGDGMRLRPLTQGIAGDERPKQFCPLIGPETLLEQTRRRAALQIPPHRTLVVVTQTHERYYTSLLADLPAHHLVVQPRNRGTAPALLYAMLRLSTLAPTAPMAVLPSDHYVSDEAAFMAYVTIALDDVRAQPELVILLGVPPDSPEVAYGWIEPADPLPVPEWCTLYGVRAFWEKPSLALAHTLLTRGCWCPATALAVCQQLRSAIPVGNEAEPSEE